MTVTDNLFNNIYVNAIDVDGSSGALISGNVIGYTAMTATTSAGVNNIGGDGILINGSDNAVVKGNKLIDTDGAGQIEILGSAGVTVGGLNGG